MYRSCSNYDQSWCVAGAADDGDDVDDVDEDCDAIDDGVGNLRSSQEGAVTWLWTLVASRPW